MTSACTATVPESVYRADLDQQGSQYERRLRSVEELRVRQREQCRDLQTQRDAKLSRLSKRLHRCELERARYLSSREVQENLHKVEMDSALLKRLARLFRGVIIFESKQAQAPTEFVIAADSWFQPGSMNLAKDAEPWLTELASLIAAEQKLRVMIGAHSDAIGTPKENWEITAGQAIAIAVKLIELGADPTRMGVNAFGRYTPRASNDTREGRSENRRIQFVFSTVRSQSSHGTKNVENK
ncbi:MAG: OmpA family protein [Myxococcota bacterium]|nr:OmpA family protein [Myxococcota bacterium]